MSIFNSIPSFRPPRSKMTCKSTRAQDMEMGIVYPVFYKELVPGDNVSINISDVIRTLPMVKPTMGHLDICLDAFFVDYRQIDPNFEDNLTGGEDGTIDFSQVVDDAFTEDSATDTRLNGNKMFMHAEKYSLMDYSGAPQLKDDDTGAFIGDNIKMTPYRALAYNRIWNYYFRDENTCLDSNVKPLKEHDCIGDGRPCFGKYGNSEGLPYVLKAGSGLKHCYLAKDYLGAVLPKRMKGGPFAFPVSGTLDVYSQTGDYRFGTERFISNNNSYMRDANTTNLLTVYTKDSSGKLVPNLVRNATTAYTGSTVPLFDKDGKQITNDAGTAWSSDFLSVFPGTDSTNVYPIYADLSSAVSFTYDEFREVRALQLYAERLNLCGSRYEEFLMSMFSVAPHSDVLREPVWLAGFSQPLVVGEVMQNTPTSDSPLGNYGGKASSATSGHFCDYFSKDFGVLVITCHIRPKVLYTQGIDRNLIKRSRFDWFNPLFANLSEQEVLKCEAHTAPVASLSTQSHASDILGFNPRYSEMYFDKDMVCGDLRDEQPYWVWSREFGSNAVLNGEFALCKHSEYSDRWVVTDLPPFIAEFNFTNVYTRPVSAYPLPH